eukprot:11680805-Ditylum_brightwellii.AAC.1
MPPMLEADSLHHMRWWVDSLFAVHPDMKSHIGGMLMMGRGAIHAGSIKQKLNTQSSTKAEIIGVDDLMPQVLWTRYFMEAQCYKVSDSIVHQDNEIAIRLKKNGKGLSSKCTRRINIRYFFMTDCIKADNLTMKYCPTKMMIRDFYTKALQGKTFRTFRDLTMNVENQLPRE